MRTRFTAEDIRAVARFAFHAVSACHGTSEAYRLARMALKAFVRSSPELLRPQRKLLDACAAKWGPHARALSVDTILALIERDAEER